MKVKIRLFEIEQDLGTDWATTFTLVTGQRFKCLRPELLQSGLKEVDVRPDGAIEYIDPHNGESVVLFPIWIEGDPRKAVAGHGRVIVKPEHRKDEICFGCRHLGGVWRTSTDGKQGGICVAYVPNRDPASGTPVEFDNWCARWEQRQPPPT